MAKYIVSGYWHDKINDMTSPLFPTVHDTYERAFKDVVNLVEDDLDGIHYTCSCYKHSRCYYAKNKEGYNREVACIGETNAYVTSDDITAEYIITKK